MGCAWCVSVRPSVCLFVDCNDYKIVRGLASLLKEHPASDLKVAATAYTYIVYVQCSLILYACMASLGH